MKNPGLNFKRNELTHNGKTQSIGDWARETGIDSGVLYHRVRAGWTDEKTLTTPVASRVAAAPFERPAERSHGAGAPAAKFSAVEAADKLKGFAKQIAKLDAQEAQIRTQLESVTAERQKIRDQMRPLLAALGG